MRKFWSYQKDMDDMGNCN